MVSVELSSVCGLDVWKLRVIETLLICRYVENWIIYSQGFHTWRKIYLGPYSFW